MDENIERSDLPRGNTVPQSLILRKLCFPESRSLLVHLMLFPYRYLFINVGSNHLLNFFLNPKKSLLDYFSFIAFGCLYFFIIWGGMFGLLGLFLTAAVTGALPSAQGTSAGGFSTDAGLALIFLPFMVLGWILGVYVLKVRYNFYKIPMESHEKDPE